MKHYLFGAPSLGFFFWWSILDSWRWNKESVKRTKSQSGYTNNSALTVWSVIHSFWLTFCHLRRQKQIISSHAALVENTHSQIMTKCKWEAFPASPPVQCMWSFEHIFLMFSQYLCRHWGWCYFSIVMKLNHFNKPSWVSLQQLWHEVTNTEKRNSEKTIKLLWIQQNSTSTTTVGVQH